MNGGKAALFGGILLLAALTVFVLGDKQKASGASDSDARENSKANAASAPVGTETPVWTPGVNESDRNQQRRFVEAFAAPITFYGKVVDEANRPLPNAKVEWDANDNPDIKGPRSKGKTTSDGDGLFTFNTKGIGVYVSVSKEGYYRIPTSDDRRQIGSATTFQNFGPIGNTDLPIPPANKPAILKLKKKGVAAALIHIERSFKVPRDGTPIGIDLSSGKTVPAGRGDIVISMSSEDANPDAKGEYDWQSEMSVPNGGLVERYGEFDFEAPASTYRGSERISMSKGLAPWRYQEEKQYFFKLGSGCYARAEVRFIPGGHHFVAITAFLNPEKGSRNLEYDKSKEIPER